MSSQFTLHKGVVLLSLKRGFPKSGCIRMGTLKDSLVDKHIYEIQTPDANAFFNYKINCKQKDNGQPRLWEMGHKVHIFYMVFSPALRRFLFAEE